MTKVGLYAIDISTTLEPNKSHRGNYICKLLQVAMRPAVDRRTAAEISLSVAVALLVPPGQRSSQPDDVVIGTAPAHEGLQGVIIRVDETRHDDHPASVDHGCSRRLPEVHPHGRNCVIHHEHVGVLELSEDTLVSAVRIHGEHERGVPTQIATSARVTRARSHDPDHQGHHHPAVRVSPVCPPSGVQPPRRQPRPASLLTLCVPPSHAGCLRPYGRPSPSAHGPPPAPAPPPGGGG